MRKFGKTFWIVIGLSALFFIVLMIVSSVLQLGERLRTVSIYLEYSFYVISTILFIILIIRPIILVLFSPTFSIDSLFNESENAKKNYHMYKNVAKNLQNEEYLNDNERKSIKEHIQDPVELKLALSEIFDKSIKKELNKMIVTHAESIYITTAISQNGKLDALAVLTINLRLIKNLVIKCGFRPSYAALGRLSFNVLSSALIAENLEDMNFSELLPKSSINALYEIPVIKTVTGSLAQGAGNALLSLRVGIICRNYLFMNLKGINKREIKKMAFAEAMVLFPRVIGESAKKIPKRFKDIFANIF